MNQIEKQIREALPKFKFRDYQKSWLTDNSRFRIALKSRQIGFSYVFAAEGLLNALLNNKNQLFASASQDQSEIMISYASEFCEMLGIKPFNQSTNIIELPNGTYLKALPKNYRTIQGFTGDVYFDEFAWNTDDKKIWRVLIPSITAVGGKVSVASTPYAKRGRFYDLWTNNKHYSKHKISIYDAVQAGLDTKGKTPEQFVNELKIALDDPEFFPSAYECMFIDDSDSYVPFSLIEPLQILDPDEKHGQCLWLGIDIGRKKHITSITAIGENETSKNKQVRFIINLKNTSYDDQLACILNLFRNHYIYKAFFDRTGLGDNLYESVKKRHPSKCYGIHFNMNNKEQMAKNLKMMLEREQLELLKDREAASHYASIKRIAAEKGFRYDTENDAEHHGDMFWSLGLGLYPFLKNQKKVTSRFIQR